MTNPRSLDTRLCRQAFTLLPRLCFEVMAIVSGLKAGMQTIDMLPGSDLLNKVQHRYFEGTKSVPVEHSGIWQPALICDDLVCYDVREE